MINSKNDKIQYVQNICLLVMDITLSSLFLFLFYVLTRAAQIQEER